MYIDFIKNNYSDKSEDERTSLIAKDKVTHQNIIMEKMNKEKSEIIERIYQINDIGSSITSSNIANLVHEAKNLHGFGFYFGSIAVIGIASEEHATCLINKNKDIESLNQYNKISELKKFNLINDDTFNKFNFIRKERNRFIHSSETIKKTLSSVEMEEISKKCINSFLSILKQTTDTVKKSTDISIKSIIDSSSSFTELSLKMRNMSKKLDDIDLQILDKDYIIRKRFFKVMENPDDNYYELTLLDISNNLPFIVDLTQAQKENILNRRIMENNIIFASIISAVNDLGLTNQWILLEIYEVHYFNFV